METTLIFMYRKTNKNLKFTLYNNVLYIICILILNLNVSPVASQLMGSEKTMEQFLDRLLHESVYDRRIRPFYSDKKGKLVLQN